MAEGSKKSSEEKAPQTRSEKCVAGTVEQISEQSTKVKRRYSKRADGVEASVDTATDGFNVIWAVTAMGDQVVVSVDTRPLDADQARALATSVEFAAEEIGS